MLRRCKAGLNRMLGLQRPGRNLSVYADDTFIVSYPKSGNTWTRFLIANLLHPEIHADFGNINDLIPDPEALSKRKMDRMPRPRVIKSHQYFDPRYPNVVYIVRDPRDGGPRGTRRMRRSPGPRHGRGTDPLRATRPTRRARQPVPWFSSLRESPGFTINDRYEDMMNETTRELSKLAAFLGRDVNPLLLAQAVERSSAEQMRKLENTQARLWSSTKDTRQDVPFVRSARAGAWKSELPRSSVVELETAWGHVMKWLGYELSCDMNLNSRDLSFTASVLGGPAQ